MPTGSWLGSLVPTAANVPSSGFRTNGGAPAGSPGSA